MNNANYFVKSLLILSFIIFFSNSLISCNKAPSQKATLEINAPSLNKKDKSSIFTSFATIQIPIQITNDNGFKYQAALNVGANNIQIPIGTIHIKLGFIAMGLNAANPTACSSSSSNSSSNNNNQNTILYSEFTSDYNIDVTTTSININFPDFSIINFDHFGFMITDSSGGQASNAQATYYDPISGLPLIDPCDNTPFNDSADSQGRLAEDLPIYSSSLQFGIQITSSDGKVQKFLPTFVRGATNAQFYNLSMANATVSPIDENTVSFIGDGYSIAYRRDTLHLNPRFPDFTGYTINSFNYTSGGITKYGVNLYPSIASSQNYDLIKQRKINVMCKIMNGSNIVTNSFQICDSYIPDVFNYPSALNTTLSYSIDAYLIDSEDYIASYNINSMYPANYYIPAP